MASRAVHRIWQLPTAEGTTPRFFPRTIATFWKLKEPSYSKSAEYYRCFANIYIGPQLASLLQSYGYNDFEIWGEYDNMGERIERSQLHTFPVNTSPLEFSSTYTPRRHTTRLRIFSGLNTRTFAARWKHSRTTRPRLLSEVKEKMTWKRTYVSVGQRSKLKRRCRIIHPYGRNHRGEIGDYKQTRLSPTPDRSLLGTSKFSTPDTSEEED